MAVDSIIIGSGLAGLGCGIILARHGRKVLIVEQHREPAPVVRGFNRAGLYFDSGFHYVGGGGFGGPLPPMFRHLGIFEGVSLFPFDDVGFDQLRIAANDETLSLPVGLANFRDMLHRRFPAEQQNIDGFLDEISARWRSFPYLNLDNEYYNSDFQTVHEPSLAQSLAIFAQEPILQSLFSMHSLLYGVSPEMAPETLNHQVVGSYLHSVHGVKGGGRQLVAALLKVFEGLGGTVRCQADVTSILVAEGKVTGVELTTGDRLQAREVIATCNPTLLPSMVPAGILRPAYDKRLQSLYQTPSALILYGRCRHPAAILQKKNLYLVPQAGIVTANITRPLEQRPMYLAGADQLNDVTTQGIIAIVPTAFDEVAAWDTMNGRSRSADYRRWKEEMTQRMCRHIRKQCPELTALEPVDLATPLTLRDFSRAPQGAIYGTGRVVGQYNPQPQTRLPGLYLSGQAVAGPGLLGTLSAAYLTCGTILGHSVLHKELRACR